MIKHRANPNDPDQLLSLFLQNATPSNGLITEAVKALVEAGANVDNQYGYPPIVSAVDRGNLELVTLLLKKGANPNVRCFDQSTLECAQEKLKSSENTEDLTAIVMLIEAAISKGQDTSPTTKTDAGSQVAYKVVGKDEVRDRQ